MIEQSSSVATPTQPVGSEVLVSGASFAGLATAHWLNRLGYRVTLIELAGGLRTGGTPVDIEGEAIGILDRMGLIDAVWAKPLPPRRFEFKDADDRTIGEFGGGSDSEEASGAKLEIHRDDLLDILFSSIEGHVQVTFGRSIERLDDGPDGVGVTFTDGSRHDYALVFGCDGNRSNVRRLAFGDAVDVSHFMGGYFLIKVVPTTGLLPADTSQIFSVAGRPALLNGYADRTDIALAFRSEREVDEGGRDRARRRRLIHDHFDGLGWKVAAMLDHVDMDDDFYFDRLNQVRMPTWSKGRVALVGDAGYCVSPVAGMGGSMAIIGAARLGDALRRHGADHAAAFRDYHDNPRGFVDEVQDKAVRFGMATMFPADEAELAERDRKIAQRVLDL